MWLLFGGNGWIGKQFQEILKKNNVKYIIPSTRMDDIKSVEMLLIEHSPERVISLIGRTSGKGCSNIDYLELGRPQLVENVRDNFFAPVCMALLCYKYNIHFTYLGTGCIFTYVEGQMSFTEEDEPNFFGSSYSIVKGFTDRYMHILDDSVLNLRIRMPITEDLKSQRNFIYKITHYEKICSIPNSMTVLPELLPIAFDMINNKKTGTYNLCNPGVISHNEILDMYIKYIDPKFTYKNFSVEEQALILKAERSNNEIDTSKLTNEYPDVLPIYEAIEKILKNFPYKINIDSL
jgi:dTDP-4-dehydrorhamnose reductase